VLDAQVNDPWNPMFMARARSGAGTARSTPVEKMIKPCDVCGRRCAL